jgi:hypothetical protein
MAGMGDLEIFVSNRAYGEEWLDDIRRSNPTHHAVITAIIETIRDNDGGDISQAEVCAKDPAVAEYVQVSAYKLVPSDGVKLEHNGEGIRHAKYAPSKSVAVLWEKIDETIYVTFDDHRPVAYHRAVRCLCDLRLGKQVFPLKSRNSRDLIEKLRAGQTRKNKWFDPRQRHYK